jgi:uncharacterized membrane protein HdeD (DUF308 family)
VLAIVVGVIALASACIVILFPGIAVLTLVLLLGIALLFIGIDRLGAGITGHAYNVWDSTALTPPSGPSDAPGAPPRPPA